MKPYVSLLYHYYFNFQILVICQHIIIYIFITNKFLYRSVNFEFKFSAFTQACSRESGPYDEDQMVH